MRTNMIVTAFVLALSLLTSAGCDTLHDSRDFERHTNSRISTPLAGGDYFWFDVRLTLAMPLDSAEAEQQRQIWLQTWLVQRKLCPAGYEILERRPFEFLEHNPERLDLRYKVRCLVEGAGSEG